MLAAAKYIGAGVACSGLIGAGAGLDSLTLILNILGFTIILITLGTIVLKGAKGFIEGVKAAANVATIIAAGAGEAAAGNSRDDREDRKKKEAAEAEERKKQAEAEERKKQTEAEEAKKEENAKKVDSFKNNIKSSSFILGWILSNVNVEINDSTSQLLQFSYNVFLGSIVSFFCLISVVGYIITNYILDKVDLEKKYPRIGKYLNRFKKIALFYVFIDLFLCLLWLFLLIFSSLVIIAKIQPPV